MNHSLRTEGFGVRLRPVRIDDAAFLVWLRNLDHAKGKVGDTSAGVPGQEAWLKKYFDREGDYYFVIETQGGIPVGAYGIYDQTGDSAESGRWVIRPEVPAGLPSAMLAFDLAFKQVGLKRLRVSTVATNQSVLSLNRKLGLKQIGIERGARVIGGVPVDLVNFELFPADWSQTSARLVPMARIAEAQVLGWERGQLRDPATPPAVKNFSQ